MRIKKKQQEKDKEYNTNKKDLNEINKKKQAQQRPLKSKRKANVYYNLSTLEVTNNCSLFFAGKKHTNKQMNKTVSSSNNEYLILGFFPK